jgi:hypothetical protein
MWISEQKFVASFDQVINMFNAFPICKGGNFASIRIYLTTKQQFMRLEFEDIFDWFLFVMAATKFCT